MDEYKIDFWVSESNENNMWYVDVTDSRIGLNLNASDTAFSVDGKAVVNGSPIVTEETLRSIIDEHLETKQENDLLKRFAQSLMEKLYGKGHD